MNLVRQILSLSSAMAMIGMSAGTSAATVPFTITGAQFMQGAGYGIDRAELNGTLLDVRYSTSAFMPQSFALGIDESVTFDFGTLDLQEVNAHGGIDLLRETDDLGISASLTFIDQNGVAQVVTISGAATATAGSVSDSQVDFVIDWSPVPVLLGNGGLFQVSLDDVSLSRMGSQVQSATVTLLGSAEQAVAPQAIELPEPAPLALLAVGMGGVAVTRRRRTQS
ncbi:PEP-CTERM sorting domain-containing protein [Roseateles violae]|uniref:PEP-CTERM sorting domain-containing protein n=1 Tax=Roseateles violae TaxID=3058042 RepID=A0ABT8DVX6_9BURK|nr:PEP-CTERM sorting domain-containing protein [Pelomonas sp. PFR6]MDN3922143.1 PEP-CTERM sorting domain-containing protein [Pelomonas sp. PFR6]